MLRFVHVLGLRSPGVIMAELPRCCLEARSCLLDVGVTFVVATGVGLAPLCIAFNEAEAFEE